MPRNRVLSFMSQLSQSGHKESTGTTSDPAPTTRSRNSSPLPFSKIATADPSIVDVTTNTTTSGTTGNRPTTPSTPPSPHRPAPIDTSSPAAPRPSIDSPIGGRGRSNSRPLSMIHTFQPPLMDVSDDTIPELQPIFTFLNSHANKLYQEGYFLKLDDQNTQGRPNPDRTWTECFAQLVGTVLSLWDAAELDAAGENGEVLPKFINLTDASIKMIESLPTRSNDEQPLQNILSISTAGRNRYLLHFNSHHSLLQWTAGIRLSMFEHSTLQEAYTGALIAGKGKTLNNINLIMERARFKTEEWVRVRFGAGVPWRRCWCVISPPDEKEFLRVQKELKKKSPYDHKMPMLKGDIKFYDTKKDGKKQKKAKPIASITDAYSCYSIYPQAKSLIDASTLIKIEGNITIHSEPPSSTEGFVFIMPEVPPAVSGFEMLLRFLFPTWDTFCLYGRPGRLVASVLDSRSLMFAMPKHKRYGYLEIMDVIGLIHAEGSGSFSEREWRKRLKELTGQRMNAVDDAASADRSGSRRSKRLSIGPGSSKPRVGFADDSPEVRTSRSFSLSGSGRPRDTSAPATDRQKALPPLSNLAGHQRNVSDSNLGAPTMGINAAGQHHGSQSPARGNTPVRFANKDLAPTPERQSSEDERPAVRDLESLRSMQTPEPVQAPPAFNHGPAARPAARPYHSPELRRAHSRLSTATLAQLAGANGVGEDGRLNRNSSEEGRSADGSYDARRPGGAGGAPPPSTSGHPNAPRDVLALQNPTPPRSPAFPPSPMSQQGGRSPMLGAGQGPPGQEGARRPSPGPPGQYGPGSMGRGGPPPPPSGMRSPPPQNYAGGAGRGLPAIPPKEMDARRPSPGPGAFQPFQPSGPPPPGHSSQTPPPGQQMATDQSNLAPFHRKPIPARGDSFQRRGEPSLPQRNASLQGQQPPSMVNRNNHAPTDSLQNHGIDESVLQMIDAPGGLYSHDSPQRDNNNYGRSATMRSNASSNYEDAYSSASPDYASTRESMDTQESVERPRAGVLRTVGNANYGQPQQRGPGAGFDIPEINFGPTVNYAPRNKAPPSPLLDRPSSAQGQNRPYPPRGGSNMPPPPRGPLSPAMTPSGHDRQDSGDTIKGRSMPWQPGMGNAPPNGRSGALSPEQFVQHRAAAAATPLYSHQRTPSGGSVGPPLRSPRSESHLGGPQQQFAQQQQNYRGPPPSNLGRGGPGPGLGPRSPMNSPPLQQGQFGGGGGGGGQHRTASPGPGQGMYRGQAPYGPPGQEQRPSTAGSMRPGQGPPGGYGSGTGAGYGQGRGGGGGQGAQQYRQGY